MKRVAIAGLGLIGGSLGMALRRRGVRVVGVDPAVDPAAAVASGACDVVAPSLQQVFAPGPEAPEVLVLAATVDTNIDLLAAVQVAARAGRVAPQLVITDVSSTKKAICGMAGALAAEGIRFVGSHPLAGAETSGLTAARADLFDAAWWAVVPTEASDEGAVQLVEGLVELAGASPARMEPAEHDRLVASTSHVPHMVAIAVGAHLGARAASDERFAELAGRGFLDTTRVADGAVSVWLPIVGTNSHEIRAGLDDVIARLRAIRDACRPEVPASLIAEIELAQKARDAVRRARAERGLR